MPAINFMEEMVIPIQLGTKLHTIRPERKRPIKAGDTLYLYTGQRTSHCERIGVFPCLKVRPIQINTSTYTIVLDSQTLLPSDALKLIGNDGFNDIEDFFRFFQRYDLKTRMNKLRLIQWANTPY